MSGEQQIREQFALTQQRALAYHEAREVTDKLALERVKLVQREAIILLETDEGYNSRVPDLSDDDFTSISAVTDDKFLYLTLTEWDTYGDQNTMELRLPIAVLWDDAVIAELNKAYDDKVAAEKLAEAERAAKYEITKIERKAKLFQRLKQEFEPSD